ncbi:epidermal differentiation-specific protein-like, partial [Rhincodon typus]|uniref:epidermal differentiation-specific protein-like n=1 Tax=Rhincodon typus TaxID=259920 RepID=UPI00202DF3EA
PRRGDRIRQAGEKWPRLLEGSAPCPGDDDPPPRGLKAAVRPPEASGQPPWLFLDPQVADSPCFLSWLCCTQISRTEPCDLSELHYPCIILYEEQDFGGLSLELHDDADDLLLLAFNNATMSLKVRGAPWQCCVEAGCSGDAEDAFEVFEEGCYADLGSFGHVISAVRAVRHTLEDPGMRIYTNFDLGGVGRNFSRQVNLAYSDVNDLASSHVVDSGVWLLSSNSYNAGRKRLAQAGTVLDYSTYGPSSFNDMLSHLCPLRQGLPIVVEVRLECGLVQSTSTTEVLNELLIHNASPLEQLLTVSHQLQTELGVSESFTFSSHTVLREGVSFSVTLSDFYWGFYLTLGTEMKLELERGFQVEKGVTESWRRTLGRSMEVEARVPANRTVKATILLEEKVYVVPVIISIQLGFQLIEERANLTCVDRTCVTIEYELQD